MYELCVSGAVNTQGFVWKFVMRYNYIYFHLFIHTHFRHRQTSTSWAIQRSWFARVNAFCNLSRKKSREVAAHFRADF